MKKIKLILLLLISSLFYTCNKDEIANKCYSTSNNDFNSLGISIKDGILIFQDIDIFEKTIISLAQLNNDTQLDEWENSIGFFSMRRQSVVNNNEDERPIYSESLSTLVNPQGIIQINNTMLKMYRDNNGKEHMLRMCPVIEKNIIHLINKTVIPGIIDEVDPNTDDVITGCVNTNVSSTYRVAENCAPNQTTNPYIDEYI